MTDDSQQTLSKLIDDARTCMLTTFDTDGTMVSRPMATQDTEFDGDVWMFAFADSPKVQQIQADPRVNLAYSDGQTWVSLTGRGEVVRDVARNQEYWNTFAEAWFQTEPDDPKVILIKVHGEKAEYWDSPSTPVQLVDLVRSKVTGTQPSEGDNEKVDLT